MSSELVEVIKRQNLELQRKNLELTQLYSDLRESFEALSELNIKLRAVNDELRMRNDIQAEFINVAAHELRTPTQSIIGYCEMLEMFPDGNKDYLERLARNADRLYRLISDLLDVTRLEIGILKLIKSEFNLTSIVSEVINDMKKKTYLSTKDNLEVKVKPNIKSIFPSSPIMVHADRERIAQVIINLLNNAIKFTNSGIITVSIKPAVRNLVTVSIKDTGRGIDSEIQPKLFQKFSAMSDKGIGLGLFISKNIIEAHGGSITGKNNKHARGATFSFTLPTITTKNK